MISDHTPWSICPVVTLILNLRNRQFYLIILITHPDQYVVMFILNLRNRQFYLIILITPSDQYVVMSILNFNLRNRQFYLIRLSRNLVLFFNYWALSPPEEFIYFGSYNSLAPIKEWLFYPKPPQNDCFTLCNY